MSNILKIAGAGVSVAAEETDENFNQTVLLLHGDGTNGAQNNTFLDSSTNNFTITRNGNTTQGTFSPFSAPDGRWSNYFDGTGDYLNTSSTLIGTTATTFTIEAWIYMTAAPVSTSNIPGLCGDMEGGSGTNYMSFGPLANGTLGFQWFNAGNITAIGDTVMALNTWNHIAVVVNSSAISLYVNGTAQSITGTTTITNRGGTTSKFTIGVNSTQAGFTGYASNIRVTSTAVYTSGFTPSTSPLTAVSGTSLLTCQSNRFVDNSTNNFAITRNGDVKVTPFSPFAPTAAYSASVNGGSGYFDGTGDYLSTNASATLSGDFTIECWINHFDNGITADPGQRVFSSTNSGANDANNLQIAIANNAAGVVVDGGVFLYSDDFLVSTSSASITGTGWRHVAVSRSGTNLRLFLDGVQVGTTTTNSTSFSVSNSFIGTRDSGTSNSNFSGYISNFRLVNGTALYTSAFTPSTSPLTAVSGTSLLLNFTNAGIFDNTGKNVLETVGNAQIDTTTKKFGTGSMEFDGTGDYLLSAGKPENNLNIGNFTVEFWLYLNNLSADQDPIGCGNTSTTGYQIRVKATTGYVQFLVVGGASITTTTGIAATTWTHVAIVRSGTTVTIYLNGVDAGGSGTVGNSGVVTTEPLVIGLNRLLSVNPLNGFIDDLRITNGVARTITVPTKAYPDL